jgi:methyl-accepting chemotaxis protein
MTKLAEMQPVEMSDHPDLLQCIEAAIQGDYTLEPQDDDAISMAVRKLIKKLRHDSSQEMSRVVELSIQVNESAIFSAQMLSNLRKVDSEAQAIAAAAEEMGATVKSIGDYGQNISSQASDALSTVNAGSQHTRQAVERMSEISSTVQNTVEQVTRLAAFSDKIGSISGDIKKVADQTNLLALNATIEAARAGEAGRGFAVVAGEVKSLANQTRKSTEEINDIISQLQSEMRATLSSMKLSEEAVSKGQESIAEVEHSMHSIQEKIDEVTQNTNQISSTLDEQSQASLEVAKGITMIAGSSTQSVEGIEKIVDAMNSVESLISAQIAKLATLEVPDKVIKLAQSDHVIWKKRLANMVIGREGLKAEELADHHSCRLGKWYDAVNDPAMNQNPIFKELAGPHERVHQYGIQAVEYFNNGKLDAALEEINKVEEESKSVLQLLSQLENNH